MEFVVPPQFDPLMKSLINLLLGAILTLTMHLPSLAATSPDQEAQILTLVELALDDESGREFIRSFALSSGQRVDDKMLSVLYAKSERTNPGSRTQGQVFHYHIRNAILLPCHAP